MSETRLLLLVRQAVDLASLGASATMREVARQVAALAAGDRTPVLLRGESGTGKGWVARVIHNLSPLSGGPFIEVHCGGTPATLLDAELELAKGGTIFLDEIGELPPALQAKVLQGLAADVRLIAATTRDLARDVAAGGFHKELYDRLSAVVLLLPPLRERAREDRLDLVNRLLRELRAELPGCPADCAAEVIDRLASAPWPGNVREMRNVLERAMILARGQAVIGVEHLPADLRQRAPTDRRYQAQSLSEIERQHIERTLRHHGGNRTRAAAELGISRATLINKIKVYSLNV